MTGASFSYGDVVRAHERLVGVHLTHARLTSTTANERLGAQLYFKCENFQRMGAFKFRGAYNALAQFTPEQRRSGVVAFSSGNHAQGDRAGGAVARHPGGHRDADRRPHHQA